MTRREGKKGNQNPYGWILLMALCLLLAGTTMSGAADEAGSESSDAASGDKVVARVNGHEIRESYLNQTIRIMSFQNPELEKIKTDEDRAKVREAVLRQLVSKELLSEESRKMELKDKDARIQEAYAEVLQKLGGEEGFQKSLEARGVTRDWFMKELEEQILIQAFVTERIGTQVSVSEEDVKNFYEAQKAKFVDKEKVKTSHILIAVPADASDETKAEARKRIESARERAMNGEDFGALAVEFSEDPSAKGNKGDLGYVVRGVTVPEFERAAFELEPGKISEVVTTPFGYHIIKVDDHVEGRSVSFEEAKDRIEAYLKDMATQKLLSEYLDSLKDKSKIEVFLN